MTLLRKPEISLESRNYCLSRPDKIRMRLSMVVTEA
jgi:hypothetical protein